MPVVDVVSKCPICGEEPRFCQWTDTLRPNATWIECTCGLMSASYYSGDKNLAKSKAFAAWNKRIKGKRTFVPKTKPRLKKCMFCGSKDVSLSNYNKGSFKGSVGSFSVRCNHCGVVTDEISSEGDLLTESQAVKLWNTENKK